MKHIREILKRLRDLDISVEVAPRSKHIKLSVSKGGGAKHTLVVSSTPTNAHYTVHNAVHEAKQLIGSRGV